MRTLLFVFSLLVLSEGARKRKSYPCVDYADEEGFDNGRPRSAQEMKNKIGTIPNTTCTVQSGGNCMRIDMKVGGKESTNYTCQSCTFVLYNLNQMRQRLAEMGLEMIEYNCQQCARLDAKKECNVEIEPSDTWSSMPVYYD